MLIGTFSNALKTQTQILGFQTFAFLKIFKIKFQFGLKVFFRRINVLCDYY